MINPIKIARALAREKYKEKERSPHWSTFRKAHLGTECCACGTKLLLQLHHVKPFHEFPENELDPKNVITLCALRGCHLDIGHRGNYTDSNPNVRADAARVRATPEVRRMLVKSLKASRTAA